jgi:predicted secreted acid phosphatase
MKSLRSLSRAATPPMVATLIGLLLVPAAAIGCPCGEVPKPEAKAPELNRLAGIEYSKTPEAKKQFADAIAGAKKAILDNANVKWPAIVSDIDETLLDNREEFEAHPDFKWSNFEKWMWEAKAPTLKPTAELLSWARQRGVAIFLITGRPEKDRPATIQNLLRQGVAYDGLYMRPESEPHTVAEEMKTKWRKKIEDMGYTIVVNIGDQYSDLYGGHSIDCEKLPNKMYYIP